MTAEGTSKRPIELLLVEDNPADVQIIQQALRDVPVEHHLHVARDGIEAMAFLRREEPFADVVRPDLVLLDLNMPKKDGFSVIADVRDDEDLRRIPVVVLTTSDAPFDINRAYDLGASSYITKTVGFDELVDKMSRCLQAYWVLAAGAPRT